MEQPLVKQERKKNILSFFLYAFCGVGGLVIATAFFWVGCRDIYPQLSFMACGVVMALMSAFMFYLIIQLQQFELYPDRLVISSIFGQTRKTILIAEIRRWQEKERKSEYSKWTDLLVYTDTQTACISSNTTGQYARVKELLTRGKQPVSEDSNPAPSATAKVLAAWFFCLSLYFFGTGYFGYVRDSHGIPADEITTISGRVIYINRLNLGIDNSDFKFIIRAGHEDIVRDDSIWLDIKTTDYLKKITHRQPLTIWDKTVNYRTINVYGLRYQNQTDNWRMGADRTMKSGALSSAMIRVLLGCLPLFVIWGLLFGRRKK